MQAIFELPITKEPGTEFAYKPDPQIIVYLLEDVYRTTITDLVEDKIFSYFENKNYSWSRADIEGLQVSIQLLDELGKLYLHKGTIGKKCIFEEEYYEESISKHSEGGFPECLPYGFGGWNWYCTKQIMNFC